MLTSLLFLFLVGFQQPMLRLRKTLNDTEKFGAYTALKALYDDRGGKFKKCDKKKVAAMFGVHIQ